MNSYNSLDDVRDYLIPLGFNEYEKPPFRYYNDIATCFQKCYKDDIGKKYFIDAEIWDWSWTDRIKEQFHISFRGQFYQKYTHEAVNFEFIDWKLEEIEKWLDAMFDLGLLEHYETWENS